MLVVETFSPHTHCTEAEPHDQAIKGAKRKILSYKEVEDPDDVQQEEDTELKNDLLNVPVWCYTAD